MKYAPVALLTLTLGCSPTATTGTAERWDFDPIPVPDFALTERDGRTVARDDLKGKVWVASFIFTRCSGGCPKITANMARLQKAFVEADDLRLVSITVDPDYDTPEVLRDYADRDEYRADGEKWLFLTGEEQPVHEIVKEGFHIDRNPVPDAQVGESIDHGTKVVLVDRDGQIRGYYDGFGNEGDFAELTDDIRALLTGKD